MKRILALVMAIGIFSISKAQHVSLGPSVGFGHSWISDLPDGYDIKFKPTFNVGATFVYSTSEHFGIGADAKASIAEGVRYRPTANSPETEINATYIRVPLKAIYFFNNYGDKVRPKVFAGPSFGFLIGGKTKVGNTTAYDTKNYWDTFDFGLTGGAGLNIRIKNGTWLNLDVAYIHGLTNVYENESTGEAKNRTIGINAGVTFPIGRK